MSSKTKANKTWGLVRMDGTSKLYHKLMSDKKSVTGDKVNPRLWQTDWRK